MWKRFIATAAVLLCMSCARQYISPDVETGIFRPIGPREAQELISSSRDLQIVDTRTGWERSSGWIEGSEHISYFTFLFGGGYDRLDKELPVLLICAHGVRSYRVGRSLVRRGWKEVYDLEGGMKKWVDEGYPVANE